MGRNYTEVAVGGTIFDGFEGYLSRQDQELREALKNALVVFDTNVLLNLYRYRDETRQSIAEVMTAIGDRLWIPHQVVEEFWRNRERALTSPISEVRQSSEDLRRHRDQACELIRAWVNKAALSAETAAPVEARLTEAFESAQGLLDGLIDEDDVNRARSTHYDPVVALLEPALRGRIGAPMTTEKRNAAIKEGKRRVEAGEPPGFADAKKTGRTPEDATGDYLVWEQLLSEAERRQLAVVFVTGDVKRDWWRYESNSPRGPRIELCRELADRCGTQLYMLRPEQLLGLADALSVAVEPEAVKNVERTTLPERASSTSDAQGTGWTAHAVETMMHRLVGTAPVQEATIRAAAQQGGYIDRDEVYRLGEYEPDRQLKGFTRPVNRVVQALRDSGELPEDASDALSPVYDEMTRGFGWVDGFRVPDEVARFLVAPQRSA
ncbi:PIN-like domain-containing protein [Kribbella sp. CA-247076]|uniref:PIN-like domain-containing protein n=1 Tax=Kribbella sp. CA-247076 TaxID=3239941 RepID=UPI003D94DCBE